MLEVWDYHKRMYDARWNGEVEYLSMREMESEFVSLAEKNQVELETINIMLGQLYIPPYKYIDLPEHLKHSNSAKKERAGRPSMGLTRKLSLTLPNDIWTKMEKEIQDRDDLKSMSAFLREVILKRYEEKEIHEILKN